MIHRIWQKLGVIAFYLAWPALWLYLRWSTRTRIVVVADRKLLVVQGWLSDGRWSLPGGGLHRGEDPLQGVIRELREEAGIMVAAADVRCLADEALRIHGLRFRCIYYAAQLEQLPRIHPQRFEILTAEWLKPSLLQSSDAGADVLRGLQLLDK